MDKDTKATDALTSKLTDLLLKSNALQLFLANFNPYASIKDLSAFLQIPYATVHGWVSKGKLPCTKVDGSDPKIFLRDLQLWIEEHAKEVHSA